MEYLVLGLALLAGTLTAGSPLHRRDLSPIKEVALDMAPNSFDDQYRGCGRMMEEELQELNRTEFTNNSIYANAWTIAAAEWRNRRGRGGIRFTARSWQSIRFGHFTSASLRYESTQNFGQDTFFSMETCYGVPIRDFSSFPEEEEVLIPPFESFEVTSVTRNGSRALIQLRSQAANSTYNCEFVKEKRCRSRPCVFSTGWSIPRDPPHLWGLLLAATALAAAGGPCPATAPW
ncbi:erythroblast NAD(P)(+)--arginine ADP-ribosyltransferase [Columba livia]|uniref:NAD(P)(+)--arginine ADP-ribosyltransferase n=1 Tax=Columba livia TaxID=8932 RepID=A0A2I0LJW0_COLLI|nr:erythroblast NAD(P)(+)--arginine ADP-ribosyltransferase [Columba livia]PKK17720.1 erythroblast NAD(P)(+)--arginine ADP-ribosyltransferase [Columba livia]